jgi:DNA mismatch repair protein MutS
VLRDGPGNRLYGLEVAKSLHLPEEFLERAYKIRNKYFPDMRGDLSASPTKYNAAKLRSTCEICKTEWAEETHHLQEQHLADDAGRIGSINVNHPANLMALCEKCHLVMHQSAAEYKQLSSSSAASLEKPKVIRKKTTGQGYTLSPSRSDKNT